MKNVFKKGSEPNQAERWHLNFGVENQVHRRMTINSSFSSKFFEIYLH